MELETKLKFILITAFVTLGLDFLFHTFFTSPEEILPYFGAIFLYAVIGATVALALGLGKWAILIGGLVFISAKAIEYYFVYLDRLYNLAVYPPAVINGLSNGALFLLAGYPLRPTDIGFIFIHLGAFLVGSSVALKLSGMKN